MNLFKRLILPLVLPHNLYHEYKTFKHFISSAKKKIKKIFYGLKNEKSIQELFRFLLCNSINAP